MNRSIDLDEHVRRARGAWEQACSEVGARTRVELYARIARRLRVGMTPSRGCVVDHGLDRGLAVRVFDAERGTLGFAAASGEEPEAAAWAARTALAEAIPIDGVEPWALSADARREETVADAPLPEPEELAGWLADALAGSPTVPTEDPWVEASITAEVAWADDRVWIRSARRVWGISVAPCVAHPDAGPVPRVVAARSVGALSSGPWPLHTGEGSSTGGAPPLREAASVVFDGDAVGVLVPALVRALEADQVRRESCVGPGWIVDDDPRHPEALVSGAWDDAGFPTRRIRIADGKTVVGAVAGSGTLRRGSFRDAPESTPTFLVVRPPPVDPPEDGFRVYAARIEALEGGWIVAMDGVRSIRGAGTVAFGGAVLRISAADLASSCVGGVGATGQRSGVVLTPALRFDGLRVEG